MLVSVKMQSKTCKCNPVVGGDMIFLLSKVSHFQISPINLRYCLVCLLDMSKSHTIKSTNELMMFPINYQLENLALLL